MTISYSFTSICFWLPESWYDHDSGQESVLRKDEQFHKYHKVLTRQGKISANSLQLRPDRIKREDPQGLGSQIFWFQVHFLQHYCGSERKHHKCKFMSSMRWSWGELPCFLSSSKTDLHTRFLGRLSLCLLIHALGEGDLRIFPLTRNANRSNNHQDYNPNENHRICLKQSFCNRNLNTETKRQLSILLTDHLIIKSKANTKRKWADVLF